jgi:hypothetical protein
MEIQKRELKEKHIVQSLTKAELPLESIFFPTQFPSLGIFIDKKSWKSAKLRPPSIQLLKLINVILVFLISNFFTIKKSQRRKCGLAAVIQLY